MKAIAASRLLFVLGQMANMDSRGAPRACVDDVIVPDREAAAFEDARLFDLRWFIAHGLRDDLSRLGMRPFEDCQVADVLWTCDRASRCEAASKRRKLG